MNRPSGLASGNHKNSWFSQSAPTGERLRALQLRQHDGSFVFQDVTGAVYRVTLEGKLVWYGGASGALGRFCKRAI